MLTRNGADILSSVTSERIKNFLYKVDKDFPVALSDKTDLSVYADKLFEKATLCIQCENDSIISMVAGYTDNLTENMAYIALVATAVEGRGKGHAYKLVKEFISICKDKNIKAVHLYTDKSNEAAIKMYYKLGFVLYVLDDDPRPDDVHLVYYIR